MAIRILTDSSVEFSQEELKQANEILDIPSQISTSVGWVCAKPDEKLLLEEYVKQADKVMYQEKKKIR